VLEFATWKLDFTVTVAGMTRCGVLMLSPPLGPTAIGVASPRDVYNVGWSPHGLVVKGGVIRLVSLDSRRCRPSLRATAEDNSVNVSSFHFCDMSIL